MPSWARVDALQLGADEVEGLEAELADASVAQAGDQGSRDAENRADGDVEREKSVVGLLRIAGGTRQILASVVDEGAIELGSIERRIRLGLDPDLEADEEGHDEDAGDIGRQEEELDDIARTQSIEAERELVDPDSV